MLSTITLLVIG